MSIRWKPWPGIIFVLLGANMVIVGITIVATARTATPVEADYDIKALHWDDLASQNQRNKSLGWTVVPTADAAPGSRLRLEIRDAEHRPVLAATSVLIRPAGHNDKSVIRCTNQGDGQYLADAPLPESSRSIWVEVTAGYSLFASDVALSATSNEKGTP